MCTDFILPFDKENPLVISAKTMDFVHGDYQMVIRKYPCGISNKSTAPKQRHAVSWTNPYGFIANVATYGDFDRPNDGLNTAGLSVSGQWLSYSEAEGPDSFTKDKEYVCTSDLITFILGNCGSVSDVCQKLEEHHVWTKPGRGIGHYAIHDKQGKNLVVEFIDGRTELYNNEIGVMTNGPNFDWQVINYNYRYRSLSSLNNDSDRYVRKTGKNFGLYELGPGNGYEYEVLGAGMYGLPGDSTSPSRFVRAAKLSENIPELSSDNSKNDRQKGVQYALQVLGRIAVCEGEVRLLFDKQGNPVKAEERPFHSTLWKVVRNHTDLVYYYNTHLNQNIQAVDLKELDFGDGVVNQTPFYSDAIWFHDVSKKLRT